VIDLNAIKSLSMQDILIIYLLRHMSKKDVSRGLSVTPSSVSQRLTKIAKYIDLKFDDDGRINYELYLFARGILCHARKTELILQEVREKIKEKKLKEEKSRQGGLYE